MESKLIDELESEKRQLEEAVEYWQMRLAECNARIVKIGVATLAARSPQPNRVQENKKPNC